MVCAAGAGHIRYAARSGAVLRENKVAGIHACDVLAERHLVDKRLAVGVFYCRVMSLD